VILDPDNYDIWLNPGMRRGTRRDSESTVLVGLLRSDAKADLQGCDKECPEHDVLLLRYLFSVRPASAAVTPVSCRFFFSSSVNVRIAALSFLVAALTVWMRAL
jgi:hypothetical protein